MIMIHYSEVNKACTYRYSVILSYSIPENSVQYPVLFQSTDDGDGMLSITTVLFL
jgi:hypothetical protein